MKQFLKMLVAVLCGLALFTILGIVIVTGLVAGGSSSPKSASEPCVLSVNLGEVTLTEQSAPAFMALMGGSQTTSVGIRDAVKAVERAAQDPNVSMIYLKADGSQSELANLAEFRAALSAFRASGKPVIAFTEAPSISSYYVCSVADKVYMTSHQGSTIMMNGVSAQMMFLKDLLDKVGVNVQLIRHGKYKSAGEMFVRNAPSAENLEQYQTMVGSMWESMAIEIARSRSLSIERVNEVIDGLELCLPQDFVDCGFADGLMDRPALESKVATLMMASDYDDVKWISLPDYVAAAPAHAYSKDAIAVIYAEGEIMDGSMPGTVSGDSFASLISDIRKDDSIAAVVLRVNSPGGSVLASEKIKTEVDRLREVKPVIASYGATAASGGYWISANCDHIFTGATTLTGSIGVFGMVPDFSKVASDLAHVNVVSVNSNEHGDMYSLMRPFDKAEYDYMTREIEAVYDKFTALVADARGMSVEDVDAIAQGRVWTGADAVKIGLADEIGTLEDAIAYAASKAGLEDPEVVAYPGAADGISGLLEMLGMQPSEPGVEAVLPEGANALLEQFRRPRILARMPYEVTVK